MKKLLCVLLVLVILCSFAACGQDGKVTIYIPDTITIYQADTLFATINYTFEEGWQNKESFTVTAGGDTDKIGGGGTVVYSDKKLTQEVGNGATMESYYNDNGQETKMVNLYADGGHREVIYNYDSKGRLISEEERMYETADSEAVVTITEYICADTDDGYTVTQDMNGYTIVSTFNKEGQQLSQVSYRNDEEMSRTEATYDEAGNMTSQINYYNGQKQTEMRYTWKTVEVSKELAARVPQFKTAK